MRKLKKILTILFAVLFTISSNGAYMYFKFFSGNETALAEDEASVSLAQTSKNTPSPTFHTYESDLLSGDEFGDLTFEYPKEWKKSANNGRAYYYAAENTFLMLGRSEIQNTLDDAYFDSIIKSFKNSQENFLEIYRERTQNKNGVKYYIAKYNQTINKENYLCSLVVLKVNSSLYIIGFTQPVSNTHNYSEDFDKIVNSFKLKK